LNLTQPAVSLRVRELETRLGVPLVVRLGKQAHMTPAGRELIDHARHIFAAADRVFAIVDRHRDREIGRVHVGTGMTALTYILPPAIRELRQRHPDIELVFSTGTTAGMIERMQQDDIDIGLVTMPVPLREFHAEPFRDSDMVAIFAAADATIPAKATPRHMTERPLILETGRANQSRLSRAWLASAGADIRPAMEFDNIEVIKSLVAAGLGASIIPGEEIEGPGARPDLSVRPLDPPLRRSLALIWRRDRPLSHAAVIVRDAIMRLSKDREAPRASGRNERKRVSPGRQTKQVGSRRHDGT
jgi:DNA-binding transcriptional LysR family regulator